MARPLREGTAAGGPTAGHPTDPYPRASFALMSVSTFLVMIGLSMLSPVLATLAEHRGLSPVQVGLLLGAYPLGRVVSAVPSGVLADRFTMSRAASIGCVLTISASIGAGVAPSFPVLLAMQLLQGVGSSIHTTAALAFVMAIVPSRRVGRLLATHQGIVLLGVSFSPVLGGVVVTYGGVNGPFWMYAVVVAAAWTLAVQAVARAGHRSRAGLPSSVPRPLPSRAVSPGTGGRALLRNRTFLVSLVIGFGLHWMVSGIRNTLVPLYAELELGFEPLIVGVILGAGAGANGIALLIAGRMVDRVGRRPLLMFGCLAVVLVVGAFSFSGQVTVVLLLIALGAANGYAGAAPPVILADVVATEVRGTAVGIQRTFTGLGLWLGPVCIGYIVAAVSYRTAFMLSTGIIAAMLVWSLFAKETMPHAT